MTTKEAINYFGSVPKLAAALGLTSRQAVYQWGETPPKGRQYEIEAITDGKLKADR